MATARNISKGEFQQLKDFLQFFINKYLSFVELPENEKALNIIDRVENEGGFSVACKSLLQGIKDCVEMSSKMGLEEIQTLDRELASIGAMTLSEVRLRHSSKFRFLLKKRSIGSEHDLYMVKGVLELPEENLDTEVRAVLQEMVSTYELTLALKASKRRVLTS
jgi:hypothetical protein